MLTHHRLTPKQKELIRGLANGMSLTEAALAAGYSDKCPTQSANQAISALKRRLPDVMEKAGLTDEKLITKYLTPALEAMETKFAQKDGHFLDEREVIAWSPRLTALDMAFNLKGSYAKDEELDPNRARVTLIMDIPRPNADRNT